MKINKTTQNTVFKFAFTLSCVCLTLKYFNALPGIQIILAFAGLLFFNLEKTIKNIFFPSAAYAHIYLGLRAIHIQIIMVSLGILTCSLFMIAGSMFFQTPELAPHPSISPYFMLLFSIFGGTYTMWFMAMMAIKLEPLSPHHIRIFKQNG